MFALDTRTFARPSIVFKINGAIISLPYRHKIDIFVGATAWFVLVDRGFSYSSRFLYEPKNNKLFISSKKSYTKQELSNPSVLATLPISPTKGSRSAIIGLVDTLEAHFGKMRKDLIDADDLPDLEDHETFDKGSEPWMVFYHDYNAARGQPTIQAT